MRLSSKLTVLVYPLTFEHAVLVSVLFILVLRRAAFEHDLDHCVKHHHLKLEGNDISSIAVFSSKVFLLQLVITEITIFKI